MLTTNGTPHYFMVRISRSQCIAGFYGNIEDILCIAAFLTLQIRHGQDVTPDYKNSVHRKTTNFLFMKMVESVLNF